jgi:hypothetical protein
VELDESVRREMDRQIFNIKEPPIEKLIDQVKFHRFMKKMEEESRKNQRIFLSHRLTMIDKYSRRKEENCILCSTTRDPVKTLYPHPQAAFNV